MTIGDYQFRTELIGRPFREGEAKGRSEGRSEGRAKGRVEAMAESVVAVLEARGLSVPDRVRGRVAGESDPQILSGWLRRAATVEKAGALFE